MAGCKAEVDSLVASVGLAHSNSRLGRELGFRMGVWAVKAGLGEIFYCRGDRRYVGAEMNQCMHVDASARRDETANLMPFKSLCVTALQREGYSGSAGRLTLWWC